MFYYVGNVPNVIQSHAIIDTGMSHNNQTTLLGLLIAGFTVSTQLLGKKIEWA